MIARRHGYENVAPRKVFGPLIGARYPVGNGDKALLQFGRNSHPHLEGVRAHYLELQAEGPVINFPATSNGLYSLHMFPYCYVVIICSMLVPQVGRVPRAIKRIQLGSKQDNSVYQQQQGRHGALAGSGGGDPIADYRRRGKERRKKNEMTYEHCLKEVRFLPSVVSGVGLSVYGFVVG